MANYPLMILPTFNRSHARCLNAGALYVLRAWIVAAVPSILYFGVLVYLGIDSLRPPARGLDAAYAAYSILLAPLLETALMLALALLLRRLIPHQRNVRIVLVASVGALAHRIGGGWEQVLASLWPFLVYSATLTTWLAYSRKAAFGLTALVHALYNATFFGVGLVGLLVNAGA